jgi:hypothetical protein
MQAEGNLVDLFRIMEELISECAHRDKLLHVLYDMFPVVFNCFMALTADGRFGDLSYHCMCTGILLCVTEPRIMSYGFLEACVAALNQPFKVTKVGCEVKIRARYYWGAMLRGAWETCMYAMCDWIKARPDLCRMVLELGWIPYALRLLDAEGEEEEEGMTDAIRSGYMSMLSACAMVNEKCKVVILRNGGLRVANNIMIASGCDLLSSVLRM